MIAKRILVPERVREIKGSFAFIEHRFLQGGFWAGLGKDELLLYFFLILAGDRNGISFYGYDLICSQLAMTVEEYILARDNLIDKDMLAFDGTFFQVLSLPEQPPRRAGLLKCREDMSRHDAATVSCLIRKSLEEQS